MRMTDKIQDFFERYAFGVCAWWGKKLGVKSAKIRLFFIYISFLTLGSPLIVYFVMAFILEHKYMFKFKKRSTVWDI
jgi:phage shock protein PspC (stress-responsive transcriptional regulator)